MQAHPGRAREMASTSNMGASSRGGEDSSSYYSSDDEEDALAAGAERGTRRLLHARDHRSSHYATEPLPTATAATSLYPQIHTLATPPVPLAPTMPQVTHTQYGSVSSTSLPSSTRSKPKTKRYRLPFFILLLFDCGLVIFLSIISYDSKVTVYCKETRGLPNSALFSFIKMHVP